MKIKKRKKTLVLVIPRFEDVFNSFYAGEIIKGASVAASRLKIDLLVHIVDRADHRGWLDSSLLDHQYIDGVLFADIDNDVETVKKVIRRKIPTLVLNNFLAEPINCISIDNYHAVMDIVRHLAALGHSRIATITGDLSTQAGQMRLEGFCAAMAEAQLSVPKNYLVKGGFLRTLAKTGAQKLLRLDSSPTAIFAASDVMALEVMDVAKAAGLKVPEELSVIGFDDNPLNYNCYVPLTTVAQPLVEMGRLGIEQLNAISRGEAKLPVKMMLRPELIFRKSTAAPRGSHP